MQDLNDLQFFAQVVEHGGFAAAGRALGIPKSKLSRRVALLEERLGVRLIQRSSRRFAVTEIGRIYHGHCLAMLAEAEAAQEAIERTRSEPQGTVRLSCPVLLAQSRVTPIVSRFLREHPRVRIEMEVINRRVDVIEEGFDLALRVRQPPLEESELVLKVLGESPSVLVASPGLIETRGLPREPGDLARFDSLTQSRRGADHAWMLTGPDGAVERIPHRPRLVTDDMTTLRHAALDGVGVVQLPSLLVSHDIAAGALTPVLPEWSAPPGLIHAVFPSRRGLVPAVRSFIDFLAAAMAKAG
jgi:DNA-binding transcriptional LysR family regulator